MTTLAPPLELLTWTEICECYPDAWVMIGYPETERKKHPNDSMGQVLYFDVDEDIFTTFSSTHIQNYKEKKAFNSYMARFTGKTAKQTTPRLGLIIKKVQDNKNIDFDKQLLWIA